MNKETLLTPEDVKELSGFNPGIEICQLSEIYNIEYRNGRNCIGYDLWLRMIAAKVDYSNAPVYDAEETYNDGDVVIFKGVFRQANKTTTKIPTFSSDWTFAPKFEGDAADLYNDLYSLFVGPYLALTVVAMRLPFVWSRIESIGVIHYDGDQMKSTDSKDYDRTLGAIHRDRNDVLSNLNYFVRQILEGKNETYSTTDATSYLKGFPIVDEYLDGNDPDCYDKNDCNNGRKVSRRYRFG